MKPASPERTQPSDVDSLARSAVGILQEYVRVDTITPPGNESRGVVRLLASSPGAGCRIDQSPGQFGGTVPGSDAPELTCWSSPATGKPGALAFEDVTEEFGLVEPLTGMHGHAAAIGDVNDDGFADVVVGTFADRPPDRYAVRGADGPRPDQQLLFEGAFTAVEGWSDELGRTSGALFADLDNDSDDDLLLIRHAGIVAESP